MRLFRSFYTVIIYIILFSCCIFFCSMAEKYSKKSNRSDKIIFLFFSIITICIPCVFAGLRGRYVGTDVMSYAYPQFNYCEGLGSFSKYLNRTTMEFGYASIVSVSALIFHSFNFLLFITELLQLLPVYIVAYRLRDRAHMSLVVLSFILIHYIVGFNIMRQSIAAAFLLLAYVEFFYGKKINTILYIIIGCLFHNTAFIGILFLILGILISIIKTNWKRILVICASTVFIVFLALQWSNILLFLSAVGIMDKARMLTYISVFNGTSSEKSYMFEIYISQYLEVIFKIFYFGVPFLLWIKSKRKADKDSLFTDSVFCISFAAVLINILVLTLFHSAYGYRFALYGEYYFILLAPLVVRCNEKSSILKSYRGKILIKGSVFLNYFFLFVCFYILYMYFGNHETLPLYFELYKS